VLTEGFRTDAFELPDGPFGDQICCLDVLQKRNLQDEPKQDKCQDGQGNARNGQPFLKGGLERLGSFSMR